MSAPKIDASVGLTAVSAHTASLTEILEILAHDGGVIVHDMLSPQTVTSLRQELDPTSDTTSVGPKVDSANVNYFWGEQTKRFTRLAQRSQTFADQVLIHPILINSKKFYQSFFLGDYAFVAFRKNSDDAFVAPIQERYL